MRHDLDYGFVRPELNRFLRSKLQKPESGQVSLDSPFESKGMRIFTEAPYAAVVNELGLSPQAFSERFLEPWRALTPEQTERVFAIWNNLYAGEKKLHLKAEPVRIFRALRWSMVQVIDLLPTVAILPAVWDGNTPVPRHEPDIGEDEDLIRILFLGLDHLMPVRQCLYCGQPDVDKRGVPFKLHTKLCHLPGCTTSTSDPVEHEDGCCATAWKQMKKSFDAKCRYYDRQRQTCEREGKQGEAKEIRQKLIGLFRKLCEDCYQRNLRLQWDVRPRHPKPDTLKWVYEDC